MSQIPREPSLALSPVEPSTENSSSEPTKGLRTASRLRSDACSGHIHSHRISNASAYSMNFWITSHESNDGTTRGNPLHILTTITDVILLFYALIILISLGIVFSIVGLAITRMSSVKDVYYDVNVARRFTPRINE